MFRPVQVVIMTLYVKGFKIDRQKIAILEVFETTVLLRP